MDKMTAKFYKVYADYIEDKKHADIQMEDSSIFSAFAQFIEEIIKLG